jgi:hypothetical protein
MDYNELMRFVEIAATFYDVSEVVAEHATSIMKILTGDTEEIVRKVYELFLKNGGPEHFVTMAIDVLRNLLDGICRSKRERERILNMIGTITRMLGNFFAHNYPAFLEQAIILFDNLDRNSRELFFDLLEQFKQALPKKWKRVANLLDDFKDFLMNRRRKARKGEAVTTLIEFLKDEGEKFLDGALDCHNLKRKHSKFIGGRKDAELIPGPNRTRHVNDPPASSSDFLSGHENPQLQVGRDKDKDRRRGDKDGPHRHVDRDKDRDHHKGDKDGPHRNVHGRDKDKDHHKGDKDGPHRNVHGRDKDKDHHKGDKDGPHRNVHGRDKDRDHHKGDKDGPHRNIGRDKDRDHHRGDKDDHHKGGTGTGRDRVHLHNDDRR